MDVTKLTVVTVSQQVHISNHCIVYLRQTQCYMSIIFQFKNKEWRLNFENAAHRPVTSHTVFDVAFQVGIYHCLLTRETQTQRQAPGANLFALSFTHLVMTLLITCQPPQEMLGIQSEHDAVPVLGVDSFTKVVTKQCGQGPLQDSCHYGTAEKGKGQGTVDVSDQEEARVTYEKRQVSLDHGIGVETEVLDFTCSTF